MTTVMPTSRPSALQAVWRLTGRSWLGLRTRAAVLLAGMVLSAAKCGDSDGPIIDEELNRAAAESLGVADRQPALHVWADTDANKPVRLYVDLSQSMRGFLDDEFRTDSIRYRAVIDILDARLHPTPIYGFGSTVRVAGERALSTLGNREIYRDGNTQLEDVFPYVAADSGLGASHLIIGDGRRADPNRANDQYVRMRQLAQEWIRRGGTFAVAASQAPFRPVASDPSGCHTPEQPRGKRDVGRRNEESGDDDTTCPLYAFAFIAPGDERRVANALAERFEHLFVTPSPAAAERAVTLRTVTPTDGIALDSTWVNRPSLGFVARSRGEDATAAPLDAEIVLTDAGSAEQRGRTAALRDEGVSATLYGRRLHASPEETWEPVVGSDALIAAGKDPFHWRFATIDPNSERIAYRIELVPTGSPPAWLRGFDAESVNDALRTYGLGRLFQGFTGTRAPPVLRAYVVAN